jgi:hypothetical protein
MTASLLLFQSTRVHASAISGAASMVPAAATTTAAALRLSRDFFVGICLGMPGLPQLPPRWECANRSPAALYADETNSL